ncbi:MAG: DNA repair protein RecO [Sphingomonadaceae bacterium]
MLHNAVAIICSIFPHGEHGSIVRALSADHGLLSGYVRGGRSRVNRPILMPANIIEGSWRARTDGQLAGLTAELVRSRAPLHSEPLAAAALDWVTALTAATLAESYPYPSLYSALDAVLTAIEAAPAAWGWATSLVRYELLILQQLGFGLDLERCAVTGGSDDLVWVSPTSARAVSRVGGVGYEGRLLTLPDFLASGNALASWDDVLAGLTLTGHFIERSLLGDRRADVMAARARLVDRLTRAA